MPVPPPTSNSSRADSSGTRSASIGAHVLRPAGQGQREVPRRGLLFHRRGQVLAIDEPDALLVGLAGPSACWLSSRSIMFAHARRIGRQADVIADVEASSRRTKCSRASGVSCKRPWSHRPRASRMARRRGDQHDERPLGQAQAAQRNISLASGPAASRSKIRKCATAAVSNSVP